MRPDPSSSVEIEVRGLSVYTHHGVTAAEREIGQRLVLDVALEVSGCEAVRTDRVEDTVDYGEVAEVAASTATERSHHTLERLCQIIGERLVERYGCDRVRVRAAKPEPPLALTTEEVAVTVVCDRDDAAREDAG